MLPVAWLLAITCLFPHGDLDDKITELTKQINLTPGQIILYQQRGELYVAHEEYLPAISDFRHCLQHNFSNSRICLGLSESFLRTQQPDSALVFIEKVLREEPTNPNSLDIQASTLERLDLLCEAAAVRESLLTISSNVTPAIVLNAASAWLACSDPASTDHAIDILKTGIERTGYVRLLQQKLVSIYVQQKKWTEALHAQDIIVLQSPLKVRTLYERASIYISAGQIEYAKNDLLSALVDWDNMPRNKRDIDSLKELRHNIQSLLSSIEN